jgi:hypothetical protein
VLLLVLLMDQIIEIRVGLWHIGLAWQIRWWSIVWHIGIPLLGHRVRLVSL